MNIYKRLKALEEKMDILERITKSTCRMKSGETRLFLGFDVLLPFLEGEITSIVTNNPELASLLRGMDAENEVRILITDQA